MDALKRNLFIIISGLAAVAGIALAAVGHKSMDDVQKRMNEADSLLSELNSASQNSVSLKAIRDVQGRVDAIQADYARVVKWAHERNLPYGGGPLVEGIFPKPGGAINREFRNRYNAELARLLSSLKAGAPPTPREVGEERDKIDNERPRRDRSEPKKRSSDEPEEEPLNKSGLITEEEAKWSAPTRAALKKARTIHCYAGDSFLHVNDRAREAHIGTAPEVFWDAQRTLWIQQDVVAALVRVNQAAAAVLGQDGIDPWVGVLPVKDLVSIRVSNYVFEDSEGSSPAGASGDAPAVPPGSVVESFTEFYSNDLYDVLQFSVKLVVDARAIPTIVREICQDRFYTPLRVVYRVETPNLGMSDKIYGEDPVVRLVVDFDACYFGDVYRRWMPDVILEEIGQKRPGEKEDETDE